MTTTTQEFGIVGLGRMGGNLALHALELGMRVIGFTLGSAPDPLVEAGLIETGDVEELVSMLSPPRLLLLYVPAGSVIDETVDKLAAHLSAGDVIVDGGNSYWGDSIRRQARLAPRGLHFVDVGTSGGVDGAGHGACFMIGGEPGPVARVRPLLEALAVPGGVVHAGPSGAGHFTKLVHNGIEFGMLQAIGEGLQLLERHHGPVDVAGVLEAWRHGSVIRSWLIDLLAEGYRREGGLAEISPYVDDTGEVNWLVDDAMRMEVPVPVIAQAVMALIASRDPDRHASRAVAMMRHGFGSHPYGPSDTARIARESGRVGDFPPDHLPGH